MKIKKWDVVFYGMAIVDYLLIVNKFPQRGAINATKQKIKNLGGSATNSATYTSSWGLSTGLVGCHYLGKDMDARFFCKQLKAYPNIDATNLKRNESEKTHSAYIIIDSEGERTIIADPPPEQYCNIAKNHLRKTRLLCVDGKFAKSQPYMRKAVLMAKEENVPVILSDTIPDEDHFAYADIAIISEQIRSSQLKSFQKELVNKYEEYPDKIIIITLGPLGCILLKNKNSTHFPLSKHSLENHILDTTGAGDTFRAGIVYGYLQGWSIERSISLAMFVGTKTCTYYGGSAQQASLWIDEFYENESSL